jgi:hypothetical protein
MTIRNNAYNMHNSFYFSPFFVYVDSPPTSLLRFTVLIQGITSVLEDVADKSDMFRTIQAAALVSCEPKDDFPSWKSNVVREVMEADPCRTKGKFCELTREYGRDETIRWMCCWHRRANAVLIPQEPNLDTKSKAWRVETDTSMFQSTARVLSLYLPTLKLREHEVVCQEADLCTDARIVGPATPSIPRYKMEPLNVRSVGTLGTSVVIHVLRHRTCTQNLHLQTCCCRRRSSLRISGTTVFDTSRHFG